MSGSEVTETQQRLVDAVWTWARHRRVPKDSEARVVAALATCSSALLAKTGKTAEFAWKSLSEEAIEVVLRWTDLKPNDSCCKKLPIGAAEAIADPLSVRMACDERQIPFWKRFGLSQSCGSRYESGRMVKGPARALFVLYATGRISDADLARWRAIDRGSRSGLSEGQRARVEAALLEPRRTRRERRLNQRGYWAEYGVTQSGGSRYEKDRPMPEPLRLLIIGCEVGDIDRAALAEQSREFG